MSTATTFYYFAYGSNLKLSEIRRTCSTAARRCRAVLPHYSLVFPRKSIERECGVASIETCAGEQVWGGVYAIAKSERQALEKREGYKPNRPSSENAYVRQQLTVFEDGDPSKPLDVMTFIANRQPEPPLPGGEYLGIIIAGAAEWKLDAQYIARLKEVRTN